MRLLGLRLALGLTACGGSGGGGGDAGDTSTAPPDVTAALTIRERQPTWRITMISGETKSFYSRPALMYIYMGHMRYEDTKPFEDSFWEEKRLDLVRDWVTRIDVEGKRLEMHRGTPITFDKLLIATGSRSNKFGWPGQDLEGVQGLWGLVDLKLLYENVKRTRHAVIVGGGLIGIELGEMLHSRGVHVTFLVREQSYWDNVLPAEESTVSVEAAIAADPNLTADQRDSLVSVYKSYVAANKR